MPEEYTGYPTGYPYGPTPSTPSYGAGSPPPTQTPYYPYSQTPPPAPSKAAASGAVPPSAVTPGGGPGSASPAAPAGQHEYMPLPAVQQSYIENILRLNKDKEVTAYMTFEHEGGNETKAFTGVIEAAGTDHLILKDPSNGTRYLLPLIYLDYVVFQGKVNYFYPYRR